MKKLLALMAVAMVTVSMTGCSRPWTSWLNRGAECDTCNGAPVIENYQSTPSMEQLPLPPQG